MLCQFWKAQTTRSRLTACLGGLQGTKSHISTLQVQLCLYTTVTVTLGPQMKTDRRTFTVKNCDAKLLHGAGPYIIHKPQLI